MLHIKSTHEIISIDISDKVVIQAVVGKNGIHDNYKGDLVIKTPSRCYTFIDINNPISFAQILGDRIIEELEKEEITVDMNTLVKCIECNGFKIWEANSESIGMPDEGEHVEFAVFDPESVEIQNTNAVDPNAFIATYYESVDLADIFAKPFVLTVHMVDRRE